MTEDYSLSSKLFLLGRNLVVGFSCPKCSKHSRELSACKFFISLGEIKIGKGFINSYCLRSYLHSVECKALCRFKCFVEPNRGFGLDMVSELLGCFELFIMTC